jgi:hypothetical protein
MLRILYDAGQLGGLEVNWQKVQQLGQVPVLGGGEPVGEITATF